MLKNLIQYFVYETKGYITKNQLVKFLYLADLYSVKWSGKQLTQVHWYYYHNSPWSEEIDHILHQMQEKEILLDSQETLTLIKPNMELDLVKNLNFPRGLKLILDNIRREWAGINQSRFNQLSNYISHTEPIQAVKDIHQPENKLPLNLQKEREKLLKNLRY